MAQLIFLGTSGDSSITARQLRASGGIILQTEELQFHIDPGPGALVKAKEFGINPRATDAVLVSHNHLNHSNDLNAVIDAMTLGGLDKKGILISNQTTVNGSDSIIPALSAFHRSCLERIIILKPDQKAAVEDVEIHAIPVIHSDKEAIGFKLLAPTFTLGYTADTAFTKDLANALQKCDILILNTTYPGDTKTDNHLNREGATKIIERVKPKLAIITHFGFDMIKADPLLEARNIQLATGIQTVAAQDGLVINPSSYAANSSQARLSSFTQSE